jgi:putative restriction endonuclease
MSDDKYGQKWSYEETILAYYYYCKIPFGKIHKANSEIIRIASILKRTPSSVVFKMGNLGHFDPQLQKRNISGLSNASKTDAEIVARFYNNWEELIHYANRIEIEYTPADVRPIQAENDHPIGATREQMVRARLNQQFFRETVLSSYLQRCCITGINISTLLIASHIKPWAESDPKTERTNPCNGLCLNALHDKAFDKGLITVLPSYIVRVSSRLKSQATNDFIGLLVLCDGQSIQLPKKFIPHREFLEYHNDRIFVP